MGNTGVSGYNFIGDQHSVDFYYVQRCRGTMLSAALTHAAK